MLEVSGKLGVVAQRMGGKGQKQMTKLAISISPQGEVQELNLDEGSLDVLQKAVGGLIEAIDIDANLTMWVNEEFLFFSEPSPNPIGSLLFAHIGGTYSIQGTIVLTGGTDADGNTMALSAEDCSSVLGLIADAQQLQII
jgi:hypothetical protein